MKQLFLMLGLLILSCITANGQIYRVAQMSADQVRALDRQKTVVILTGGILEQHGPHLPSVTDGYSNEWLTQRLAEEIVQRPGYAVLLFPTIPLGHGGANEIGNQQVFPGTYSVRRSNSARFSWIWLLNSASRVETNDSSSEAMNRVKIF